LLWAPENWFFERRQKESLSPFLEKYSMLFELFPFTIGLLGSLHCFGMCGPLVLAWSIFMKNPGELPVCGESAAGPPPVPAALPFSGCLHHLSFHLGRITSYGVLGALAASLFQAAELSRIFFRFRGSMTVFGGVLMILMGMVLLRVLPLPSAVYKAVAAPVGWFGGTFPRLLRSRSISSKFLLGLAVGLLPCCLLWAMVLTAAATQDPARGALVMVLFGLGTMPALLAAGACAFFFPARLRLLGERVAAATVAVAGVAMVLHGAGILG
jgi:uncharacterized protein